MKTLTEIRPQKLELTRELSPCRHIHLPKRLCCPVNGQLLGQVVKKGNAKQLLIKIRATQPDGRQFDLHALIDTGAQANLIRKDMLPLSAYQQSHRPLALITADGTRMEGGSWEVTLDLKFSARKKSEMKTSEWSTTATFHDAAIQVVGLPLDEGKPPRSLPPHPVTGFEW